MRELGIPCGVVLNRAGLGDNKTEEYCREQKIPVLLTIPLDTEIARLYARGMALVDGMPWWLGRFRELFSRIKEL